MDVVEMVSRGEFFQDDRQLILPFDLPPAIQLDTMADEKALCDWENEGGALPKEDIDGE